MVVLKSLRTNFLINLSNQMLGIIVPLITTPYLSRVLGAEMLGVFSYSNSIAYYFTLFGMLGLSNYGCREIAKVRGDHDQLCRVASGIYTSQAISASIVSALYVIYLVLSPSPIAFIMLISVLSVYFDINWYYYGMEAFDAILLRNFFVRLATTILIFVLVRSSEDVVLYALIVSLGTVAGDLVLWKHIRKSIQYTKPTHEEIVHHLLANLTLFLPTLLLSVYKVLDKILLKWLTDYLQVGYYDCADKLGQVPLYLFSALSQIMIPRISSIVSKGNDSEAGVYLGKSILLVSFVSSSIIFGIVAIADTFVPLYFGPGYESCILLTQMLISSYIFTGYASVLRSQLMIPYSKDREFAVSLAVGAAINFSLVMLLVPHFQAFGAAIATFVTEGSTFLITYLYSRNSISLRPQLLENISLYVCGSLMVAALVTVRFPLEGISLLLARVALGAIVYVVSLGVVLVLLKHRRARAAKSAPR